MKTTHFLLLAAASVLPFAALAQAPIFDASRPPAQEQSRGQGQDGAAADVNKELYFQVQQLQQEVMRLRGQVEQQAHQLRQLKQQSLDRYIDLDRRIGELSGTGPSTSAGQASKPDSGGIVTASAKEASEAEISDYRNAYDLVRSQQFSQAIQSFKTFVGKYPDGRYTPNAWYWLGELYLVNTPQDLAAAEQAFRKLLEKYPEHDKVPDAKYKLGKVYFLRGKRDEAKNLLNEVVAEHKGNSAAKLAEQFLRSNF